MFVLTPNTELETRVSVPVGAALAFALLGAPVAWSTQMVLGYVLASHACFPTDIPLAAASHVNVHWLLLALDLGAATVAGGACLVAARQWRRRHQLEPTRSGERRNQFLAGWSLLSALVFLAAIIGTLAIAWVEPVCAL